MVRHGIRPWLLIGFFAVLIVGGTVTQPSWEAAHLDESIELALLLVGVPALMVAAGRAGAPAVVIWGVGLAALVAVVALGRVQKDQYLENRYRAEVAPPLTGGFRATPQWTPLQEWGREAEDQRIGVSGRAAAFGQYFFYGNDLSNHVQYIGEELRRGTFRPINVCTKWRRAINEGGYDYVLTTPRVGESEDRDPPENIWTFRDPNVELFLRSGPARIYKINGRLDPSTCEELGDLAHT
jgi:hypothetical protein